uniref:Uncharacterized protein n=1 Tax=Acrobeloides nanus TaxID=290746 RepID=A0A914D9D0_9BILA
MSNLSKSRKIEEKHDKNARYKRIFCQIIVKKNFYSYKFGHGQALEKHHMKSRVQKSRKMKRLVGAGRHRSVLFTDEKLFTVQRKFNRVEC